MRIIKKDAKAGGAEDEAPRLLKEVDVATKVVRTCPSAYELGLMLCEALTWARRQRLRCRSFVGEAQEVLRQTSAWPCVLSNKLYMAY